MTGAQQKITCYKMMINTIKSTRPEWADAKDTHHVFGLCKSTLYRLAREGKIRSSSLKERGKLRGKRLFSCDSVAAYIEKMADDGEVLPAREMHNAEVATATQGAYPPN